MKTLITGIATAAVAATLFAAAPAAAQSFGIRAGENGVSVRIGDNDRHHHYRHRDRWDRDTVRIIRRDRAECREITTRTKRANGTVVVRKRVVC